jgi:hypothetical protein
MNAQNRVWSQNPGYKAAMSPVFSGDDGTAPPVLWVAADRDGVRLWDVRAAGVAPLIFSHAEWASFVAGVGNGEFDFVTESLSEVTGAALDDDGL